MWCVSEITPKYREAMNDVLTLYEKPYQSDEPVVCFDEKSLQLLAEKREPRPMRQGMPFRRDYEYVRKGTVNVFCAVEPKAGRHLTGIHPYRKAVDFAEFLAWLAERYPNTRTIHLVMDNLNTHQQTSLEKRFGLQRGKEIWNRFTPLVTLARKCTENGIEDLHPLRHYVFGERPVFPPRLLSRWLSPANSNTLP